jgi:uncharacterized protein involved in copper resistance
MSRAEVKLHVAALALLAGPLASAQGQSQLEHVPPDPPQSHVHDMSYAEMVEMMGMDDRKKFGKVMLDHAEWRDADEGSAYAWDASAWYGGDYHKVWLQSEASAATVARTTRARKSAGSAS